VTTLDLDAFTDLAIAHSPAVLGYIARRAINPDAAPEILNDVLLVAWRRRSTLPDDPERARMWLFVVARNCLRNHNRSWNRRRANEGPLGDLVETIVPSAGESGAEVRAVVLALPARYREIVTLVHWDGFTLVEAAEILSVSASTARTRYGRARERLRASLALMREP
jgi:RNA polymerase sigma-70 factor (ECF subfamily)